jgi:hypothetical protein
MPTEELRILTNRWRLTRDLRTPLQEDFWKSTHRFNICHAGRRSGKTEIAKMRGVRNAVRFFRQTGLSDGLIIFGAPTHTQARNIFWNDICSLVPHAMLEGDPLDGRMSMKLIGGTEILVCGFDVAARSEGRPIDHLVLDEYGNMKPEVWSQNLRPALSTPGRPLGTADFVGVPEGRNHYFDLVQQQKDQPDWAIHHWFSEDVVSSEEINAAKRDLDPLTYEQEYRGSFISFQGKVYYQFDALLNTQVGLGSRYDQNADLIACFDFNRKPGVCIIAQEMENTGNRSMVKQHFTGVIDEVYIHSDSNTMLVCQQFLNRYSTHRGRVILYGDASGGATHSSNITDGSDWQIINRMLYPCFGTRLAQRVPRSNPSERSRVNAMNSRLKSFDGQIAMLLDPNRCPKLIKDLEGVRAVRDGSGRIDKTSDIMLTHSSDALGYYVVERFPVSGGSTVASDAYGA